VELEELIEAIDIVEYISQYVELEEKNGEYWGLSPFKDEVTPSFSVRRETRRFYDFSSGIGGNVFTFVRKYNDCSTKEAVDILSRYVGQDASHPSPKRRLPAAISCRKFKPPKREAKQSQSKTYPSDCMNRFERNPDKLAVWEAEGISKESLDRFEVSYDSFSNRLVYPIRNLGGDIVNIGGRTLEPDWKSRGLKKYCYFSGWGTLNVIYGLFENLPYIIEKKEIILFEGCKSVLLADSWGIRNCGALLTSHLNMCQLKLIASLGIRAVLALDKDVRVRDDHNIKKLARYTEVEYLWDRADLLSEKESPVDEGKEVFEILYSQRLKYS